MSIVPYCTNFFAWDQGQSISTDKKFTRHMSFSFDTEAKGMHTERSTFWAYDGDSPPERYKEVDAGFQEYGVMEIKPPKPIERLRIEDPEIGGRRVFHYDLQIEIVGGSIQVTATSVADGGMEVGKLVLPKLDSM